MEGKEAETVAVKDEKLTSEKKGAEQTTPKTELTYTQKQIDEAVGKGRASTQSQLSLAQAETKAVKAREESVIADLAAYRTATEDDIRSLQTEHESLIAERFEDAGERRSYLASQRDKRGATDRERKVAKREADVEKKLFEAEQLAVQVVMNRKIDVTVKETGITREDLMSCQSEAEVEVLGLRFQMANPAESEKGEGTPEFDTGLSSGGGGKITQEAIDKMPPSEVARNYKAINEFYGKK